MRIGDEESHAIHCLVNIPSTSRACWIWNRTYSSSIALQAMIVKLTLARRLPRSSVAQPFRCSVVDVLADAGVDELILILRFKRCFPVYFRRFPSILHLQLTAPSLVSALWGASPPAPRLPRLRPSRQCPGWWTRRRAACQCGPPLRCNASQLGSLARPCCLCSRCWEWMSMERQQCHSVKCRDL